MNLAHNHGQHRAAELLAEAEQLRLARQVHQPRPERPKLSLRALLLRWRLA